MKVEVVTQKKFEVVKPFIGINNVKNKILNYNALVVYDNKIFKGIISVKDLAKKHYNLVVDCITKKPDIEYNSDITDALSIMKENDVDVLPVWKNGSLLGLVFKNDLVEYMETYTTELEERIKSRTLELEEALRKSKENEQLKSAFLANLSHEIRTPINGILGFSDLIMKPGIDKLKLNKYARIINNSSKQLLAIIEDLLLMSTMETGQLKLKKRQTNLNALLTEIFNFYKPQTDSASVKFKLKKGLSDTNCMINVDEVRLRQVIDNLMINALKFTKEGEIELGYKLDSKDLYFYVKDTGIGIKPENQHLIFERFKQVEPDYLKNFSGLGLGLSISKMLIEVMGGSLSLKSQYAEGSEFFFTIPYENPYENKLKEEVNKTLENDCQRCTVLIVDDEPNNLLLLEEVLLMDKTLQIFKAINGKEAVDICKNNKSVGIVFMDIKMPVMNGIEATKAIKQINPHVIIIAQSAYASGKDKNAAINAGCDDFISKPVNINILSELIKKYKKS